MVSTIAQAIERASKGEVTLLTVAQAVQRAGREMAQLTGQPLAGFVSCVHDGEQWRVTLETVDRKAVPDSADLLATYLAILDGEGAVVNFERLRTRRRGEPVEER